MNKYVNGVLVALTQEEIEEWEVGAEQREADHIASQAQEIREQRNFLLQESDWTRMDDNQLSESDRESWANYRQALRDISNQEGFPETVEFPTKP